MKGKGHLQHVGIDGREVLKLDLKKQVEPLVILYNPDFITVFLSRVRPLVCSNFTMLTSCFCLWDYTQRRFSEFVIRQFLVNALPNVSCRYQFCNYGNNVQFLCHIFIAKAIQSCTAFD